jgi:hypothetical protein
LLLASLLPLSAEDWTTEDGKTYKNVTVVGQEDDGVRITYDGGVGKIPYYELPVDIQKRFGQDVESLAEKKRAVDRAIEAAVRSAADAEQMKQPVEAPATAALPQINAPSGQAPSGVPPNGTPSESNPGAGGTQVLAPGGAPANPAPATAGTSGGTAPMATAPGVAPNPTSNPQPGAAPSAAQASGAPGPVPPGHVAPNSPAVPGSHVAQPGTPGTAHPAPDESVTGLAEPISHTPEPTGVMGSGGKQLQLTVSNYTYNAALDVCYLDSPAIDAYPNPAPKTPPPPGQGCSLTMRIVTDGRTPQAPERFEVTFLSVGGDGGDLGMRPIAFFTDVAQFSVDETAKKDSGTLPGGGQAVQYVSFYLDPGQAHQIAGAKTLTFSVGGNHYRIDDRGQDTLRSYISDVDTLAPASSSFVRTFYKLLARIPSFFDIISTVCEYVILGSFALLVAASIAAFILGVSRFIKM